MFRILSPPKNELFDNVALVYVTLDEATDYKPTQNPFFLNSL
jgi:hypothetical protein